MHMNQAPTEAFIRNTTRKTVLVQRGSVLRSMWRMALGAMFRGLQGEGLVFVWYRAERIAITNLFVPEAIDILWLNETFTVVDIREGFRPWQLHAVNEMPARYVIEVPAGTIRRSRTQLGDRLTVSGLHAHPKPF